MRILVVEDNPSHLSDAIEVLRSEGVELMYATDEHQGLERIETFSPDGVITDIFIPNREGHPRYGSDNEPCGVAIALRAEQLGIPFIFCTSGNHHGARYQWITDVAGMRGWMMIDSGVYGGTADSGESLKKAWKLALEMLQRDIERKRKSEHA